MPVNKIAILLKLKKINQNIRSKLVKMIRLTQVVHFKRIIKITSIHPQVTITLTNQTIIWIVIMSMSINRILK